MANTKTPTLSKLQKDLTILENKHKKLVDKKDACVDEQFVMENEYLSEDLTSNKKYQKLIDEDFELASKVEDVEKEIKNKKAQIKRKESKEMNQNILEKEPLKEAINIESIRVEANRWFDKTYGNTYHTVRAIINDDFCVAVNDMTYGYENHYESTIARKLEELGLVGAKEKGIYRFCNENGIEYSSSHTDGLKRDLKFTNNDLWKDGNNLSFKTKADDTFKTLIDMIEKSSPNDTNESKTIKAYIEASLQSFEIAGLNKRLKNQYDVSLSENTLEFYDVSDINAINTVVRAEMNSDISLDYSSNFSKQMFFEKCKEIDTEKLGSLNDLGIKGKAIDSLEKRLEFIEKRLEKFKEVPSSNEDTSEKKSKLNKSR